MSQEDNSYTLDSLSQLVWILREEKETENRRWAEE